MSDLIEKTIEEHVESNDLGRLLRAIRKHPDPDELDRKLITSIAKLVLDRWHNGSAEEAELALDVAKLVPSPQWTVLLRSKPPSGRHRRLLASAETDLYTSLAEAWSQAEGRTTRDPMP